MQVVQWVGDRLPAFITTKKQRHDQLLQAASWLDHIADQLCNLGVACRMIARDTALSSNGSPETVERQYVRYVNAQRTMGITYLLWDIIRWLRDCPDPSRSDVRATRVFLAAVLCEIRRENIDIRHCVIYRAYVYFAGVTRCKLIQLSVNDVDDINDDGIAPGVLIALTPESAFARASWRSYLIRHDTGQDASLPSPQVMWSRILQAGTQGDFVGSLGLAA